MNVSLKTSLIGAAAVLVLFLGAAIYFQIVRGNYEKQILNLQNQIAERDTTIETQKGVYERLAIQSQNLTQLLGEKDKETALLKEQLRKQGAELLAANTLIVRLKKELKAVGDGATTHPDPGNPGLVRVDFDSKDEFSPFLVKGWTLLDCGENPLKSRYAIEMSQVRPFKFNVVVSQDKDGKWRTSATSSEKNFQIDIALSAVNPFMLEPKWYEKIGFGFDLGVGTNPGFLGGVGISYQINKLEVGPKAWVIATGQGANPYFGAQLLWHPFQR